jgi:ABC-2 type transport system ATP-binding protein
MVATYSGGMRRPLDLAMTLVGNPGMIFLDEPTTGLDPRSRRTMWEIIRELVSTGVTIFSLRRTGRRPTSSPTG